MTLYRQGAGNRNNRFNTNNGKTSTASQTQNGADNPNYGKHDLTQCLLRGLTLMARHNNRPLLDYSE